jgi:hypothetical protein
LDEASGAAAADSSSYARTGSVSGASWVNAVRYRGLSMAGAGKVEVSSLLNNPASFSLAAWVNVTAADSGGTDVVSLGDHALLRIGATNLQASFYNGSSYTTISYSTTLAGQGWRHVAATFDEESDAFRLYLDGALVTSTTTTAKVSYAGLGTSTVVGAHGNAGTANDLNGLVDDVQIYSKALTAAEVRQLYGFMGQWKLDETTGTAAIDSSGAGNAGVYSGSYVQGVSAPRDTGSEFGASTSDKITLPREVLHQAASMTTTFWLKTTASGEQTVLSAANSSRDNEYLVMFSNSTTFSLHIKNVNTTWSVPTISDGKWHHFAVVTAGETTTTTLYRDGAMVSAKSAGPGATPITVAQGGLVVAQEQDSVGGGFASTQRLVGALDDLRVYNRALSPAEVADIYGLMAYWTFDEGAGTAIGDSSLAARSAQVANGAPAWVSGVRGNALDFNGTTDDAITDENFAPPAEGTVAFWFRSTGAPLARARLFGLSGDWEMWQDPDGIVRCDLCVDGEVGGFKTISPFVTAGTWYHMACVYDSDDDTYSIYVNGELEKSGVSTANITARTAARLSFATRTGTTERFRGAIDDFRIYNRKLSQSEIYRIYGLVGWYKLNESSGTVASDSTGLGNDVTFTASPTLAVASNGQAAMGTAVDFNGANYVHVPGLYDRSESVSLAVWAKLDSADSSGADVVTLGDHFMLRLFNGSSGARGYYYNGSSWQYAQQSAVVQGMGWRHYAVVLTQGSSLKLYVNGVEAASIAVSAAVSWPGQGQNTRFASHGNGQTNFDFNGAMDDVRIYNRAMPPSEVYQLYRGSRPPGVRILTWTESR